VPIDKKFIVAARKARQSFNLYLEGVKEKELEIEKKKSERTKHEREQAERLAAVCNEKNSLKAIETVLKEREKDSPQNANIIVKRSQRPFKRWNPEEKFC